MIFLFYEIPMTKVLKYISLCNVEYQFSKFFIEYIHCPLIFGSFLIDISEPWIKFHNAHSFNFIFQKIEIYVIVYLICLTRVNKNRHIKTYDRNDYLVEKFTNTKIKPMINVGDLMEWCRENSQFPSDKNESFVLGYESTR